MSSKYVIHTKPVAHRFKAVTKSGIIAWEEGCLKCRVCVKKQCIYGVYNNRGLDSYQMVDSIDNQCMNCFRCVQNCPKELIHKSANPEYKALGDSYWTPDIIARLWYQAETGKIPVSGAGYPGPFSGPGFDAMWTDMSEIVRPTRDGIHGREYISTAIDLGRTPNHLSFNHNGDLEETPVLTSIPLPIMFKVPSFGAISQKTLKGWAMAARRLGTFLALPDKMLTEEMAAFEFHLISTISSNSFEPASPGKRLRLFEVPWKEGWEKTVDMIRNYYPSASIIIRIPMAKDVAEVAISMAKDRVSIIHLEGNDNGRVLDDEPMFLKDGIRSVHNALVEAGIRDEITLLGSGGLAMAEHVAKSIICGLDGVFIDFPALIALECRMCRRCTKGLSCPVKIGDASPGWVSSRVVNLLGAWHNQLLEVMGAMGLRDARRLRGETGRAMFFEDLDQATFGSMGHFEEGCKLE